MRDRLARIYNALLSVETKGTSSMVMVDCEREILAIIQELDKEGDEDEQRDNN